MNEPYIEPSREESAYATGEIRIFRLACPGCDPDFDPRRHQEAWCSTCRPGLNRNGLDDGLARPHDPGPVPDGPW